MTANRIAREASYASGAESPTGRVVVRAIENATGRLSLIRRARGYGREVAAGQDVRDVICARCGLGLRVVAGCLDHIPRTEPLVVVANLATRAEAWRTLARGEAGGIIPGGTASTASHGRVPGPDWAHLHVQHDRALRGHGGAGVPRRPRFADAPDREPHLHPTLRLGMLLREFRARTGTCVRAVVGEPVPREALAAFRGDARAMLTVLRGTTCALPPTPLPSDGPGWEFGARPRRLDEALPSG